MLSQPSLSSEFLPVTSPVVLHKPSGQCYSLAYKAYWVINKIIKVKAIFYFIFL